LSRSTILISIKKIINRKIYNFLLKCFPLICALLAGEFSSSLKLTWSMASLNLSPFEVEAEAEFEVKFDVRWPKVDFEGTTSALLLVDVFRFKSVSSTTCRNNSNEIKETEFSEIYKLLIALFCLMFVFILTIKVDTIFGRNVIQRHFEMFKYWKTKIDYF